MSLKTIDVKYYPPQSESFARNAYRLMQEFFNPFRWNSYGEAGYADLMDITMEDLYGTVIVTAEVSIHEFDEEIETFGEMLTTVLPQGSDNALFLLGLPKFFWLDEDAFPFISHISTGDRVTGIFECLEEQQVDDIIKIVCICTMKDLGLDDSVPASLPSTSFQPMRAENTQNVQWDVFAPYAHTSELTDHRNDPLPKSNGVRRLFS